MRTSRAFSAAYPALYLRQLDLGGLRLAQINGLLLAVLAVVEVPVRPALAPLLQLQHPAAIRTPLDYGAQGSSGRYHFVCGQLFAAALYCSLQPVQILGVHRVDALDESGRAQHVGHGLPPCLCMHNCSTPKTTDPGTGCLGA